MDVSGDAVAETDNFRLLESDAADIRRLDVVEKSSGERSATAEKLTAAIQPDRMACRQQRYLPPSHSYFLYLFTIYNLWLQNFFNISSGLFYLCFQ